MSSRVIVFWHYFVFQSIISKTQIVPDVITIQKFHPFKWYVKSLRESRFMLAASHLIIGEFPYPSFDVLDSQNKLWIILR